MLGVNHELELMIIAGDQVSKYIQIEPQVLVACLPIRSDGSGMAQLRRDGHEIARQGACNCARCLDRDNFPTLPKSSTQGHNPLKQHGLTPRDNHVFDGAREKFIQNIGDAAHRPFGLPTGVWGIAPNTPKIAPAEADKNTTATGPEALPLDALKGLCYTEFHVLRDPVADVNIVPQLIIEA